VYDLVPANLDERDAAEAVLFRVKDCDIFADKGFIGEDWQAEMRCHSTNRIKPISTKSHFLRCPVETAA